MPDLSVALQLFLRWLNTEHGRRFRLQSAEDAGAVAAEDGLRLAIAARALIEADPSWSAQRDELQALLSEDLPVAAALWAPGGADLPSGEPATSDFIASVREAAMRLGPHERSYVALPVTLLLRKNVDSGGVISVTGGLNMYWARFTDRVRGTYDLDSTQLHRLPESEEHLEALIDAVVDAASRLEAGQVTRVETVDAWTVQRLDGEQGVTIIGVPPADSQDVGFTVRRNLRRILAEAVPQLRERDAEQRALVVLGHYPRIEQEGATTAMRGYDPALYSGTDYVCLVADGLVKPIIAP